MGKFKRVHIHSSLITSIAYDTLSQVLEIVFCKGGIYEYFNINEFVYDDILQSESVGMYFNQNIRDFYPYRKVRN